MKRPDHVQVILPVQVVPAAPLLTVVDVFTRECLALETDTSLGSLRVIRVLEQIIAEHGAPQRIRSDNGPEFTSRAYLAWALERRIGYCQVEQNLPVLRKNSARSETENQ